MTLAACSAERRAPAARFEQCPSDRRAKICRLPAQEPFAPECGDQHPTARGASANAEIELAGGPSQLQLLDLPRSEPDGHNDRIERDYEHKGMHDKPPATCAVEDGGI